MLSMEDKVNVLLVTINLLLAILNMMMVKVSYEFLLDANDYYKKALQLKKDTFESNK